MPVISRFYGITIIWKIAQKDGKLKTIEPLI